jgi:hypothetical protein
MSDGTVMELLSRGKQDAYFIQGSQRSWFGADYSRRSASAREIRIMHTENPPVWGRYVDIELPRTGDILMSADIRIQMPTWLPPAIVALNRRDRVDIDSQTPGLVARYGWTNGLANYLIKRWALYADNLMLLEGWGAFNSWFPDMETTHFHAPLIHSATGTHDGSDRSIQRASTLPELVFRVPIMGCQNERDVGLPLCALRGQRLYLRLWMADKTELVESTVLTAGAGSSGVPQDVSGLPVYELCPAPWGRRRIYVNGVDSGERTLLEREVGPPTVYGRFAVLHVDEELRGALASKPQQILFKQQHREDFVISDREWNPASRYHRRLSIHGFFQALFLGFISTARRKQNKYRDITPPGGGEWLVDLALSVNGQERIDFWPPKKFQELANNTQLARDVEVDLYYLIFGVNPDGEPAGTCNLSRTQKATLLLQLNDVPVDPAEASNQADATLMGLSWNVFDIRGGQGRLRFVD